MRRLIPYTWAAKVPLDVIVSPYRALVPPLLKYIERVGSSRERPLTVVVSQFVPRHWWEFFLHSQTAFRLKLALFFRPDTIVIDVPYHPRASSDLGTPAPSGAPTPGFPASSGGPTPGSLLDRGPLPPGINANGTDREG